MVSLTDDEHKLVYSNLGGRLRVAGTAELSGYDLRLNHRRCRAIVDNVRKTFPHAGDFDAAQFWTGLRPATPSNLPYVGRANGYRNLWLNTGHGTLGWTLGRRLGPAGQRSDLRSAGKILCMMRRRSRFKTQANRGLNGGRCRD